MSDSRDKLRSDDDLLAEIGAGLAVDPSPGFREGVQRRVAEGALRARFSGVGWWQVAGLAAGVTVVVALATQFGTAGSRPAPEPLPAPLGPAAPRVAESGVRTSIAPGVATTPARAAAAPEGRVHAAARSEQPSAVALSQGREVRPAGPDLVVLTNQPALLRRMWADRPEGVVESVGADASVASRLLTDLEARIAITDLTIAPIVIPDVTVQTAPVSGAGGAGVRRVISAEQSARSRQ